MRIYTLQYVQNTTFCQVLFNEIVKRVNYDNDSVNCSQFFYGKLKSKPCDCIAKMVSEDVRKIKLRWGETGGGCD